MAELDFTTVVATDKAYIPHLKTAWKSWVIHRPEIILHPMVILIDSKDVGEIPSLEATLNHPNLSFVEVGELAGAEQREKMLTALVKCPPLIETEWMLKLDCDVLAKSYDPAWCATPCLDCGLSANPVFMAPSWGYTKPANAITVLDDWADSQNIPGKRLNIVGMQDTARTPGRIISYVFFGRTDWLREVASLCGPRLPIPSQDTYHWYMAKRTYKGFRYMDAIKLGWQHIRGSKLEHELKSVPLKITVPKAQHLLSFPKLLESLGKKDLTGVEVGVDRGDLSQSLLDAYPQMILHLVDVWDFQGKDTAYFKSGDRKSQFNAQRYRQNMIQTIRHTAHAWPRVRMWKMPSVEAAKQFPDGSMDFVFIDADHTYDAVMADLNAWWPKVAKGGMLTGHDFEHIRERKNKGFAVGKAVREFSEKIGKKFETHQDTVFAIRQVNHGNENY